MVVLTPADPVTRFECAGDLLLILDQRSDRLERAGDEGWAAFLGEGERLLGGQEEPLARRVVLTYPPAAWLYNHSRT